MLIVCPKCFAKYIVSDDKILSEGQKCHCSACGNYFERQEVKIPRVEKKPEVKPEIKIQPIAEVESGHIKEEEPAQFLQDETPPALFTEPLNSPDEIFSDKGNLDLVPEEFKPVAEKKSSFFSTILWLCVAGGICFAAYQQKDYLLQQIDSLIVEKLDQKTGASVDKKQEQPVEKKEVVVPVVVTPVNEVVSTVNEVSAPVNEIVLPQEEKVQVESIQPLVSEPVLDDVVDFKQALSVQNVSYEIGLNEVGMNRVLIRGLVVNTSLKPFSLPETKAVLYDETDKVVARKRVVFNEKIVDGNSEVFFETTVVPAPASVSKIEVVFDE